MVELGASQRLGVTDARIRAVTGRAASLDLSAFVKLAYLMIGCAALVYFLIRLRLGGSPVAAAEIASASLLCAVGAFVVVLGVLVVGLSFRKDP